MAVSAVWQRKLSDLKASVPTRTRAASFIADFYGPILRRYKGGLPLGFLAAIVQFESGGKADAGGDPGLGEYGLLQVAASTAKAFGLDPALRFQPEGNVFLGCLEYQVEAVKMYLARPDTVQLGTADSWKLARLAFAIGSPGTRKLLSEVPRGAARPFEALRAYVDRVGGVALGSQEAGKVWYRVHAVDTLWDIGAKTAPFQSVGLPEKIPAPAGLSYTVPAQVAPYLGAPGAGLLVAAAVVAAAYYIL